MTGPTDSFGNRDYITSAPIKLPPKPAYQEKPEWAIGINLQLVPHRPTKPQEQWALWLENETDGLIIAKFRFLYQALAKARSMSRITGIPLWVRPQFGLIPTRDNGSNDYGAPTPKAP